MNIKNFLIEKAVSILVSELDKETIEKAILAVLTDGKNVIDSILDAAKEKIRESETTIDDRILLPIIEIAEEVLGLPDD